MVGDTPDFADTEYHKTTSEGAAHLDVSLADLLSELESITVQTANIEAATLAVDVPKRYRSGTIIFMENWEHGNGFWEGLKSGAGAVSALSATVWYSKGQSWELVTGSDGGRYAYLQGTIGRYKEAKIGVEWCWTLDDYISFFDMRLYYYYDGTTVRAAVRYDGSSDVISILNPEQTYTTIKDPSNLPDDKLVFHFFKLIVDLETKKYVKLYMDEVELDLSAYSVYTDQYAYDNPMRLRFYLKGESGRNPVVYVDDIAITEEA